MTAEETKTTKEHHCSVCGRVSPQTICTTCEAKIRGEILDEKERVEKEGHTDSHRR